MINSTELLASIITLQFDESFLLNNSLPEQELSYQDRQKLLTAHLEKFFIEAESTKLLQESLSLREKCVGKYHQVLPMQRKVNLMLKRNSKMLKAMAEKSQKDEEFLRKAQEKFQKENESIAPALKELTEGFNKLHEEYKEANIQTQNSLERIQKQKEEDAKLIEESQKSRKRDQEIIEQVNGNISDVKKLLEEEKCDIKRMEKIAENIKGMKQRTDEITRQIKLQLKEMQEMIAYEEELKLNRNATAVEEQTSLLKADKDSRQKDVEISTNEENENQVPREDSRKVKEPAIATNKTKNAELSQESNWEELDLTEHKVAELGEKHLNPNAEKNNAVQREDNARNEEKQIAVFREQISGSDVFPGLMLFDLVKGFFFEIRRLVVDQRKIFLITTIAFGCLSFLYLKGFPQSKYPDI